MASRARNGHWFNNGMNTIGASSQFLVRFKAQLFHKVIKLISNYSCSQRLVNLSTLYREPCIYSRWQSTQRCIAGQSTQMSLRILRPRQDIYHIPILLRLRNLYGRRDLKTVKARDSGWLKWNCFLTLINAGRGRISFFRGVAPGTSVMPKETWCQVEALLPH